LESNKYFNSDTLPQSKGFLKSTKEARGALDLPRMIDEAILEL